MPVSPVWSELCSGDVIWAFNQGSWCWKGNSCSRGAPLVEEGKYKHYRCQSSCFWHREHLHLSLLQGELGLRHRIDTFDPCQLWLGSCCSSRPAVGRSSGSIQREPSKVKPITLTWQAQLCLSPANSSVWKPLTAAD